MAIRPSHIKDETGLETNTREARHARLRSLADSVNDTARMARNSLSLLLIVALYLGLTLVASTDENLLRNGQVVLPQIGVGLSLVESYIFAPLIFLYLHVQMLFLLTVLARKVRTFEVALKEEFPDTTLPNIQERVEAKREECRDWLSAFAFVQLFRLPSGVPHVSKVLAWLGTQAVPLILLFALDLSFVRYQSYWITWEHHIVFGVDLVFLAWFNWQVSGEKFPGLWMYLREDFLALWRYLGEMAVKIEKWPMTPPHKHIPRAEERSWEMLWRAMNTVWGVMMCYMALLLIFAAHPPSVDSETVENWRNIRWDKNIRFSNTLPLYGGNLLDAGPCKWWSLACRYLDISNKRPPKARTQDIPGLKLDSPRDKRFVNIDLAGRKLRYANFQYAQLQGADLRDTQLQGADLQHAQLQGADLQGADLQGADLQFAQLQGAYLGLGLDPLESFEMSDFLLYMLREDFQNPEFVEGIRLRKRELDRMTGRSWGVDLRGTNLQYAQLQGAYLQHAQLQGANLQGAYLQGAYLLGAQLQGANLQDAQLQGANLQDAQLQGANLQEAGLQCANLQDTWLQGTDFGDAQLHGVDLGDGKLQSSSDESDPWHLVWTPGVSYDFTADKLSRKQYLNTLVTDKTATVELAWGTGMSLEEHLRKCMEEDRKPSDSLPDNYSQPDWNAWAEWTAEFACEDEYTARSSLERWESYLVRLSGLEDSDEAESQKLVHKALVAARETGEECPGLHSIPDDEWKEFID